MRKVVLGIMLALFALAAGPASKPATHPAKKTRYTLMHGAVRFMVLADWKLAAHDDDDRHAQFQSPDGKCNIVLGVQEEEMGFPSQNEAAVEQMKTLLIASIKKSMQQRGVQVLYGPRSESDDHFMLRIHSRYIADNETFDEVQTYQAKGLDVMNVLTQVKTDKPAEAKSFFTMGDDLALSIILGPADKKRPASRPTP